jgi:hypothetical protein
LEISQHYCFFKSRLDWWEDYLSNDEIKRTNVIEKGYKYLAIPFDKIDEIEIQMLMKEFVH